MKSQNTKQERIAVFILGNGFDLAHGLATRYRDFFNRCPPKPKDKPNIWLCHCNGLYFTNFAQKWSELGKGQTIGENYFDLEQEIFDEVYNLYIYNGFNIFSNDYLKRVFNNHRDNFGIDSAIKWLYEELRDFTDRLGEYLSKEQNNQNIKPNKKFQNFLDEGKFNKIRILNFNYTNTFKKLYGKYLEDKGITDIIYYHIHGSLDEKDSLVLGTQSFNKDKKIHHGFTYFTKDNQRSLFNTITAYQELREELQELKSLNGSAFFYIIGHSLNEADHEILNHLLCNDEIKKPFSTIFKRPIKSIYKSTRDIYVYYYEDKIRQFNEHNQLRTNMIKILGKTKSVNDRVYFKPLEKII